MDIKQKWWYVIFEGRNPRIYYNWEACCAQVHKYSAPVFKKFASLAEAENAYLNYKHETYTNAVEPIVQASTVDPLLPPPLPHMVHCPTHAPLMYFIFDFLFAIIVQKLIKWL